MFRIGVSYGSFGTVSRNDASAALKAWAATVAKERRLDVVVQIEVFDRENELRQALAGTAVDAVSMTAEEFMESGQQPESVFLTAKGPGFTQQYVTLVNRKSGIEDLPALKNHKMVRHVSPTTDPALPWLETVLADRGLGRAAKFLSDIGTLESPSKSILQVFFRQSDACLVTSNAFELACELNPQLRRELKILMVSPPLIPTVFFFRPDYTGPTRGQMEAALLDLHSTTSGQQVLTVFQGSRMEKQPLACFDGTRRLLTHYRQVLGAPPQQGRVATTTAVGVIQMP